MIEVVQCGDQEDATRHNTCLPRTLVECGITHNHSQDSSQLYVCDKAALPTIQVELPCPTQFHAFLKRSHQTTTPSDIVWVYCILISQGEKDYNMLSSLTSGVLLPLTAQNSHGSVFIVQQ